MSPRLIRPWRHFLQFYKKPRRTSTTFEMAVSHFASCGARSKVKAFWCLRRFLAFVSVAYLNILSITIKSTPLRDVHSVTRPCSHTFRKYPGPAPLTICGSYKQWNNLSKAGTKDLQIICYALIEKVNRIKCAKHQLPIYGSIISSVVKAFIEMNRDIAIFARDKHNAKHITYHEQACLNYYRHRQWYTYPCQ